jgi:2-polyprenyl-6-methoxyphenol hydroxylase-like FAD-dependent oxidoreductase
VDEPITVVGGGIGGLASAIALAQRGFHVRVLEQAPKFEEIGAGIQLGPNMLRSLQHLGLRERVLDDAWLPGNLLVRDALDGSTLDRIPVGDGFRARFGQPYAVTHRADLLTTLMTACDADANVTLLTDRRVVNVAQRDDCVVVDLHDGESFETPALIGADGLWSKVRQHVVDDADPLVSGHIAYRAVLPAEDVPKELWSPDMTAWFGPRTHLVHYPLRRGTLYNLVAVFHSERYREGYDADGDVEELWRHFGAVHRDVRSLLERIDVWRFWVLCDREPRRGWTNGRVTLLGDAAHPMLQYLAQGAAMAVEDGVCLAVELARAEGDPRIAFPRYEEQRVLRTGRAQIMARVYGDVFHAADVARELRNQLLRGRTPAQSWDSMAWMYDYDPLLRETQPASRARPQHQGPEHPV